MPCPAARLDEEARSLGYYQEAHRVWPVNLDVISWLGAFHVRNEVRVLLWLNGRVAGWLACWTIINNNASGPPPNPVTP
jgi:hypothetical protein